MTIDEKTRLDLRQEFEKLFGARLADATMEAMPPLDYEQLATKTDLANLRIELRGEMAEVRGEISELRGELRGEVGKLRGEMATNLRIMVVTQLTTTLAIIGFVAGFA